MFCKEVDFKDHKIGRFPSDWQDAELEDVLSLLRNGIVASQNKGGKGIPITRIETISEERIDSNRFGYLETANGFDYADFLLVNGDILFSHINSLEHIGKTALYEGVPKSLLHGMNLLLLRPKKDIVNPKYLLYLLRLFRKRNFFRAIAKKAVNQASINQTELGRVRVPIPSMFEQKGIVEVLFCVDLAIQKTDGVIAKTERLKKGLIQKLLTEGIGHKEFKETEIGKIPNEWQVVRVEEITLEHKQGFYTNEAYSQKGIKLVRVTDLLNPKLSYETMPLLSLDSGIVEQFEVSIGDFLIARSGAIGRYGIVTEDLPCVFGSYIIRFRFDSSKVDNAFLGYLYESDCVTGQLLKLKHGATNININAENIKAMRIPLPSMLEQQRITEILSSIDVKLQLEKKQKTKFERIKIALVDLLLTGKVRAKLD